MSVGVKIYIYIYKCYMAMVHSALTSCDASRLKHKTERKKNFYIFKIKAHLINHMGLINAHSSVSNGE